MKPLAAILGLLCLSPRPYRPDPDRLVLPTVATYSESSGCIVVQRGRDEDGKVVDDDVEVCGVHFFTVLP